MNDFFKLGVVGVLVFVVSNMCVPTFCVAYSIYGRLRG